MAIKESNYWQVYQAFTRAFKPDRLELKRKEEARQSRVSVLAKAHLKPSIKERVEWSKTASSSGRNVVAQSFINEYSLKLGLINLPTSRAPATLELSAGNQWLEQRAPLEEETPLVLFFKKVGILDEEGKTFSNRPSLDKNEVLNKALDFLLDLLEQEKVTYKLENFTFTCDDLSELESQMQSFAYAKLSSLVRKSVKQDTLIQTLKTITESEEDEKEQIQQCKRALKESPNPTLSKVLTSIFLNPKDIETKAKEQFLNGTRFVKGSDLSWNSNLSIASQWILLRAFEDEVTRSIYSRYEAKLKELGVQKLEDLKYTEDVNEVRRILDGEDYQETLETRVNALINSVLLTSAPANTLYGRFSQFHKELTLMHRDISDPLYQRLADLAYLDHNVSAMDALINSKTVPVEVVTAVNEPLVAFFVSNQLGKSKVLCPHLLKVWNDKMGDLKKEEESPFFIFLASRGFFEESSQERSLSFKLGRLAAYQLLFCALTNAAAKKYSISFTAKSNDISEICDFARHVSLDYFLKNIPLLVLFLDKSTLTEIDKINKDTTLSIKEKIKQMQSLLSKVNDPYKSVLLKILQGSILEPEIVESVIRQVFSLDQEAEETPTIQEFISKMGIQDRPGASYDENYFEKIETFVKFKNYVLTTLKDPQLISQLKEMGDHNLKAFADFLARQPTEKFKEWIQSMLNQIDADARWFHEKAQTYGIPELATVLSNPLTGHQKIIAINKGFYLFEDKLKQEIKNKGHLLIFERFIEESCLHQNTKALEFIIQQMGALNELD